MYSPYRERNFIIIDRPSIKLEAYTIPDNIDELYFNDKNPNFVTNLYKDIVEDFFMHMNYCIAMNKPILYDHRGDRFIFSTNDTYYCWIRAESRGKAISLYFNSVDRIGSLIYTYN